MIPVQDPPLVPEICALVPTRHLLFGVRMFGKQPTNATRTSIFPYERILHSSKSHSSQPVHIVEEFTCCSKIPLLISRTSKCVLKPRRPVPNDSHKGSWEDIVPVLMRALVHYSLRLHIRRME